MGHRYRRRIYVGFALLLIGGVTTASAQGFDCWSRKPPAIALSGGISSAYLEPAVALDREEPNSSVTVGSGPHVAARAEMPVAGPIRFHLEAARSQWDVRRKVYDPAAGHALTSDGSIGSISDRSLMGMIGIRFPWKGICTNVAVGGGLHSTSFRDSTYYSPSYGFQAGLEFPAGARGVLQLGIDLHVINSRNWKTIATSSEVLTMKAGIGWAYRF